MDNITENENCFVYRPYMGLTISLPKTISKYAAKYCWAYLTPQQRKEMIESWGCKLEQESTARALALAGWKIDKCPDCKGKGYTILLTTREKCIQCNGRGKRLMKI